MATISKSKKSQPSEKPILNNKVVVLKRYINKDDEEEEEDEDGPCEQNYERRGDTYTIFKNHNKDLVAKIKELAQAPFDGTVVGDWGHKGKIEQEMGDQYMCMGDDGKRFFIDKDELESMKKTWTLNRINKAFPVEKYFNENFGYVFGSSLITVHSSDIDENENEENDDDFSYDDLMSASYQETDLFINAYNGSISITNGGRGYSPMFLHFNEEGNYVNRDYNLNLVLMAQEKTPTLEQAVKSFKKEIPAGKYVRKDNIWYGDKCALEVTAEEQEEKNS